MDPLELRAELKKVADDRATAEWHRDKAMERGAELLRIVTEMPTPRELSFEEAAAILGITRQNAYKLIRSRDAS